RQDAKRRRFEDSKEDGRGKMEGWRMATGIRTLAVSPRRLRRALHSPRSACRSHSASPFSRRKPPRKTTADIGIMRAIVFDRFGEPADVLQARDAPEPIPGRGEVRVRMLAAPVNPSDLSVVRGVYGRLPTLPATPGLEGVGVVEAKGGGLLGRFLMGKRVAVLNSRTGSWAARAVLPAKQAMPLSSRLAVDQCAMFFVNPATAYIMTREVLRVPRGEWLL